MRTITKLLNQKRFMFSRKKFIFIGLLLLHFFVGCSTNQNEQAPLSDQEFLNQLTGNTFQEKLNLVDSLLNKTPKPHPRQGLLYLKKGALLASSGKDKKAIAFYNKAVDIFKAKNNQNNLGDALWHLGSSNVYLSNISLANEQFLQVLNIAETTNNNSLRAKVYGSFAHIQFILKNYDKCIEYNSKAIEIQIEEKDTIGLSSTYNNMAIIYKYNAEFIKAVDYNLKSLDINIEKNDESAIAQSYNNLGSVSVQMNNIDQAIMYYKKAIDFHAKTNSLNSNAHTNLAQVYLKQFNIEEAEILYLEALKIHEKSSLLKKQKEIYNTLLDISLQKQDFKSSIKYLTKRDSIEKLDIQKENQEKLDFVKTRYESATREAALSQENQLNEKNKIIYTVLIGALLLLLFFVYQKNKNSKLRLIQEKLELEQNVLRSQMNPHFIFNALSAIQTSVMDNNPLQSASYISRFAKLIRQNFDYINKKSIPLSDEIDALTNYLDTQKMRYQNKFDYSFDIQDDLDLNFISIPPLLLQPFVENSIEHGFKNKTNGLITIKISETEKGVYYSISDNGSGFKSHKNDKKDHAIDIFKKRIKLHNDNNEDNFTIESSEKGTTITFYIKG